MYARIIYAQLKSLCTPVLYYHLMETFFVTESSEGQRRPTQPSTDLKLTQARYLSFFRTDKGLWLLFPCKCWGWLLLAMQMLEVDDLPRRRMWEPPGLKTVDSQKGVRRHNMYFCGGGFTFGLLGQGRQSRRQSPIWTCCQDWG